MKKYEFSLIDVCLLIRMITILIVTRYFRYAKKNAMRSINNKIYRINKFNLSPQ